MIVYRKLNFVKNKDKKKPDCYIGLFRNFLFFRLFEQRHLHGLGEFADFHGVEVNAC